MLESDNLLFDMQYDFRPGHTITMALQTNKL